MIVLHPGTRGPDTGVPYASALEVNLGYFERRGIDIGDQVVFVWE